MTDLPDTPEELRNMAAYLRDLADRVEAKAAHDEAKARAPGTGHVTPKEVDQIHADLRAAQARPVLDPDKMHGTADGFGGQDYIDPEEGYRVAEQVAERKRARELAKVIPIQLAHGLLTVPRPTHPVPMREDSDGKPWQCVRCEGNKTNRERYVVRPGDNFLCALCASDVRRGL